MSPDTPPPWDPLGFWRQVAPVASHMAGQWADIARPLAASAGGLGAAGARTALQGLLDVVRSRLVGRRLALGTAEQPLRLRLVDVNVEVDPVLLAAGQVDRAAVVVEDVEWGDLRFRSARAELRNVHTRPGSRPVLVAAPVEIEAVLPEEWLTGHVARRSPKVSVEITAAGTARLRWERRPELGWVELEPSAQGKAVLLRPRGVGAGRRDWQLVRRLPPIVVELELPDAVRITELRLEPGAMVVGLRADEWRLDYAEWLAFARRPRNGD
jgi:hypothetical protein